MAGIENTIIYGRGFKLQPSGSDDILRMQNTDSVSVINYNANPEGAVAANIGSLTVDRVAGVLYIKKTGTGNTGWDTVSSTVTTSNASIQFVSGNLDFGNTNLVLGSPLTNLTTGSANTGLGAQALQSLTSGEQNSAVGTASLGSLTIGVANSSIGINTLASLVDGNSNTAGGQGALFSNISGSNNAAFGAGALSAYLGSNSTAFGYLACRDVTAGGNTGVGFIALVNCGTGANNTAVGYQGLTNISSGSDNTTLGYNAGSGLTLADSGNILIGSGVAGTAGTSDTTIIGSTQTDFFVAGIYESTAGAGDDLPAFVGSDGKVNTAPANLSGLISIQTPTIDLNTTGATEIFTPVRDFYITAIGCYGVSVDLVTPPQADFGTNAPNYNNVQAGFANFASATGDFQNSVNGSTIGPVKVCPAGVPVFINVTTADTGTGDDQILYIQGFYLP